MPTKPVRSRDDSEAYLNIRLPGWLKNKVTDAAAAAGVSTNTWLLNAVHQQLFFGDERPTPRLIPSASEVIADYLAGRQTMSPCGKPFPCEGNESRVLLGTHTYCGVCNIRTS